MKVLVLNPSHSKKKILSDPVAARCSGVPVKAPYIYPPIGLAYIAGAIKEMTRSDVAIKDAQVEDFTIGMIRDFDLVILNVSTPNIEKDIKLSEEIKRETGTKVAFTGAHATYFHKELAKYADFIIRGEPEMICVNLANALEKNSSLRKVKGLTWKRGGKIFINKNEALIENLDDIPFPAIELLNKYRYYDILTKKNPMMHVITSRGCPYQCAFCSAKIYGKGHRHRSVKNVLKEVELLLSMGFKDITFFDDTFTIVRKMVMEICEGLESLNVSWRCLSRVDTVDRKVLERMYDSGCYQIQFGVESGDQRILNLMKKGVKVDQIRKTFMLCDEIGLESVGFFMFGYPGETPESIENTVKLANEIKPDFVTFNLLTPLPGSEIFDSLPRKEWDKYDFTSTSFCDIPSDKMVETIRKAYRDYYVNLPYFLRRIRKTKEPFRIIKQNINFWIKRSGVLWDFIK